jgi:hypothetical protein
MKGGLLLRNWRVLLFGTVSLAALAAAFFTPRDIAAAGFLPAWLRDQIRHATSEDYHVFADKRGLAGIPNFANVVSNLPFLVFGIFGLNVTSNAFKAEWPHRRRGPELWCYAAFFAGVTLTFCGSAYYHWGPSGSTLFWDRLPMTVAFMGILAATLADRIGPRNGAWLLVPLLLTGIFSDVYLRLTDLAGAPDPRLYFMVQYYPLAAIALLFALFPARYTHSGYVLAAGALYIVAKIFEMCDARLFALTGISGHSLKHAAAGAAALLIALMLRRRTPLLCSAEFQESGGQPN